MSLVDRRINRCTTVNPCSSQPTVNYFTITIYQLVILVQGRDNRRARIRVRRRGGGRERGREGRKGRERKKEPLEGNGALEVSRILSKISKPARVRMPEDEKVVRTVERLKQQQRQRRLKLCWHERLWTTGPNVCDMSTNSNTHVSSKVIENIYTYVW